VAVADAVIKRAPVTLALADAVSPGRYLLLFHGGVGEVDEALHAGVERAGAALLDQLYLPLAADGLVAALEGRMEAPRGEAVGVVELATVASALRAADVALKKADVALTRLQLARGIGGKGWFHLQGELHMVEAALEAVTLEIKPPFLLATELLHSPHGELRGLVL
jgi:microcompartment protein CcmL/EutN